MATLKTAEVKGVTVPTIQCQLTCECGRRHMIVVDLRGVRYGTQLYGEKVKGKPIENILTKTIPFRPKPLFPQRRPY